MPAKIKFTFTATITAGTHKFYLPTLKNGKYLGVKPTFDFTLYTNAGAPVEQKKDWGFEQFSTATDFTNLGTRVNSFNALIAKDIGSSYPTSAAPSTWTAGDGGTKAIRADNVSRTLQVNVNNAASSKMGMIIVKLPNNYEM